LFGVPFFRPPRRSLGLDPRIAISLLFLPADLRLLAADISNLVSRLRSFVKLDRLQFRYWYFCFEGRFEEPQNSKSS
jgi:hypothetical protein